MSLRERLIIEKGGSNQGLHCSVAILLRTLTGADLEDLQAALADDQVSHAALERGIKAEGWFVGTGSIGKHRRGDCRCFK